jgi:hypothetical protein
MEVLAGVGGVEAVSMNGGRRREVRGGENGKWRMENGGWESREKREESGGMRNSYCNLVQSGAYYTSWPSEKKSSGRV